MAQRNQVKAQIIQRDQEIAQLDRTIAQRDLILAQRESRLKTLEEQQASLEEKVAELTQKFQALRQGFQELRLGNVALLRSQVLSSGVIRIIKPNAARQAVDQLLREANRTALRLTRPGVPHQNEQVIRITTTEVDRLVKQIEDGRDYVVRILSAGNYLAGEKNLQVFADATLNQVVFRAGEQVATTAADPAKMTEQELLQRLDLLLLAAQFRARQSGILSDAIEIDNDSLGKFFDKLKQSKEPLDIRAIAVDITYTLGPLKVELVAVHNGQVLFRSIQ
ncbi:hypothetical protein [Neosynechococcus sphagnicola]|uniref:hypothetical protein n=1 Tax=Neosynechococcus sphagnicola TaxID=1501145 RepID=UPI00195539A9|nr:hypothetical protein [Neosynechococcus sphagnicola]